LVDDVVYADGLSMFDLAEIIGQYKTSIFMENDLDK